MFQANQAAYFGDRIAEERIAELRRNVSQSRGVSIEPREARARIQLPSINVRQSAVRLAGGVAVAVALVFSTGIASAAPPAAGFYECGPGECEQTTVRTTLNTTSTPAGGRYEPHFTP